MKKTQALFCGILVLIIVSQANALVVNDTQTWGATRIENLSGGGLEIGPTGNLTITGRVDMDSGAWLRMSGGVLATTDTFKFPDSSGQQNVRMYIDSGTFTAHDIEHRGYDRDGIIYVGGGALIVQTGYNSGSREYDPQRWLQDNTLRPADGCGELTLTDLGGGAVEISCGPTITLVQFETPASGDLETVTWAAIFVSLSDALDSTATVDYQVVGGTAMPYTDYVLADDTLTFIAGDTTEPIIFTIMDDSQDEDDETIVIRLTNPTGSNVELGPIVEHTYTIIDPRPAVGFASPVGIGREDRSPANVMVELSDTWGQTVTVDCAVIGGTATQGVDYILANGTLTFDPDQVAEFIEIDIVDDGLDEGSETIVLELSNPTGGARLADNVEHTFTISEQLPLLRGAYYYRADSDPSARVGQHPDIMVRLGDGQNKLIFCRANGFLPAWYIEGIGEEDLPVEVSRSGCETTVNWYSRAEIIETSPARAVVHWRYATNCSRTSMTTQDWVDEYFTVYPDGACIRTIKDAAGTSYSQWTALGPVIRNMQLLAEGVEYLPESWLNPPELVLNSGDYSNQGFDEEQRCYRLVTDAGADPTPLSVTLNATGGTSVHSPAIVIENWGDAEAYVTVDGSKAALYYTGYANDMYGDHLVVWLDIESAVPVDVTITPQGGSGQFIDRARPPVHSYDFDDSPPLPLGSAEPGQFGAYYTNLRFNNRFDESYRMGEHADVVVQFDDNAHRFVFWRGTNYQPHWAGDTSQTPENPHVNEGVGIPGIPYSCWYGIQFVERRGEDWGLPRYLEPMSDWQCRYSHVRIISSNPARAIVQWRYAPCHLDYQCNNTVGDPWGDWDNEYYVIYPDAISVRRVDAWSRRTGDAGQENPHIEFHEMMPITNPGTVPEDNIHWNAVSATDYSGNRRDWWAQDVDGGAMTNLDQIANRPIAVLRTKGSTVSLTVFEGTSTQHDPVGQHDCRPFNHYDDWPAWPENDRSMGGPLWDEDPTTHCYRYFWKKYPAHCSILHVKWRDYEHIQDVRRTKIMLFGMVDATTASNVNNLIPLARSWEYAPGLTIASSGFSGGSYDKTERAHRLSRTDADANELEFTINASASSPVYNPCFVIDNWQPKVRLTINGQPVESGPDFRQGTERGADEVPSLVVWIRAQSSSPLNLMISEPLGGDFDADGDTDWIDCGRLMWNWLRKTTGYYPVKGDLNDDNQVNFFDFAIFTSMWPTVGQ
ncbi:MAG: Calx-beta domain-containing protein [Planctomycetota bacterium]|jgi:hypothetical protein